MELTQEEYAELLGLYQLYYKVDVWSLSDLRRMYLLEQKASDDQVRRALDHFGRTPEKEFG